MTEAEKSPWYVLRSKQIFGRKFRRQQPIGKYIVDCVGFEEKLIIEIDGGQHSQLTRARDNKRDAWLTGQGFKVLRFWNTDVLKNREGVMSEVVRHLHPSPNPSHKGRGKFII